MSKVHEKGIVKPRLIKDLRTKQVVYFPVDVPSLPILSTLKKSALKEIHSMFGDFYFLQEKVILTRCLGAPSAALSLEPLIASGAKEIMVIAYGGSLNSDYRMMKAVSVSKALSEEGTSRHYFPKRRIFHSSPVLRKKLEGILESFGLPYLEGSIVSTDAPFRETRSWLKDKQKKGIDLVDMETSAVFALAEFFGIHAAALLIVSDELWSGDWKVGFRRPEFGQKIKEYFIPIITRDWTKQK